MTTEDATSEHTTDPGEVVTAFIRAVERLDVEAAVAHLHPEVSYENMPITPIVGAEAVAGALSSFLGPASAVEWPVSRQVVAGRTVVNERLDRFQIGDGWLELPVAGVFEVDEAGKITLWRDYFDLGTYQRQLVELTGEG